MGNGTSNSSGKTGWRHCRACDGKGIGRTCSACNGTGYADQACFHCGGDGTREEYKELNPYTEEWGWTTVTCDVWHGSGIYNSLCKTCPNSRGYFDCTNCNGIGFFEWVDGVNLSGN